MAPVRQSSGNGLFQCMIAPVRSWTAKRAAEQGGHQLLAPVELARRHRAILRAAGAARRRNQALSVGVPAAQLDQVAAQPAAGPAGEHAEQERDGQSSPATTWIVLSVARRPITADSCGTYRIVPVGHEDEGEHRRRPSARRG